MNLASAMEIEAAQGFKGRKPGGIKSRNPDKIMAKAKQLWGDSPGFDLHMEREIRSACPHMKAGGKFGDMTHTQKYLVACRMHSHAQSRVRAARLKAKKMDAGGPGSGRHPEGRSVVEERPKQRPEWKVTKEDIQKKEERVNIQKERHARRAAMR